MERINKWTDGERLQVLRAVWNDSEYSANVNIQCPICKKDALNYTEASIFDMSAWCTECQAGVKQGEGATSL